MEFIIIDDSVFDLFTQEKLLLKSGLATRVLTFGSAEQALDYLNLLDGTIRKTIILLDLQMPGLNGFEFTEQFALLSENMRSNIYLFMISSTVDPSDIAEAESNQYIIKLLAKPLDIQELTNYLNQ
ncbi:response regulator [Dyadobacter arcticus]|uniref:CheY-like chemotaxis protein n=1 Tax=Dyadobacter arcticus TaxID=1078754 RepID=A0ABX0URM0_9BACT|nr:response regulator [Dyadobacter arcticus]NIJ53631.1 CheY-like chemotaxis protein [Dyadobacter arcticus]